MAADDVARLVAKVAMEAPLNGPVEVGGPERLPFAEFISRGLSGDQDSREIVVDPHGRYFGTELSERSLVPDEGALLGAIRFEDWITGAGSQSSSGTRHNTAGASS